MQYLVLVLVALVAVATATTPEEFKEKLAQVRAKCVTDSGASEDAVTKAREGTFVDEPKIKEYLLCFHKGFGSINDNGDFEKDAIKTNFGSVVGQENIEKLIAECLIKKDSLQETAFEFSKCVYQYRPKQIYNAGN